MKQTKGWTLSLLLPRLQDILFVAIFAGALLTGSRMLNFDSDLGRHLTLGGIILDTHQIPTRDLLSFTKPNQPRPPYEWLAQVLLTTAYRFMNLDGVVLLIALVLALTFLLVYTDSLQRCDAPILALLVTILAAMTSSLHWLTRPHVFSFFFLAVWLRQLERARTSKKTSLWLFPALMLIWANTHGGFIFGFLAWSAYFAGWLWEAYRKSADWSEGKNFLIIGGTSLFASIFTPDLWHSWEAVLNNRSAFILNRTLETMRPNYSDSAVWPFVGMLILAVLFALLRKRQASASHIFLLSGLAVMSLAMARNIPLFAIAAAPILAAWIQQTLGNENPWIKLEEGFKKIDTSLYGFLWPSVAILAVIGFLIYYDTKSQTSFYQFDSQVFPVQAVNWIEAHPPQGRMFNDFNWGGYLLYRLWPNQRVFLDSQSDFYGEEFMRQYESIYTGQKGWDARLSQYNAAWIIVPREAGIAQMARSSPDWQILYEDEIAIILSRR